MARTANAAEYEVAVAIAPAAKRYGERREDSEHEDNPEPGPPGEPGRNRHKDELRHGTG